VLFLILGTIHQALSGQVVVIAIGARFAIVSVSLLIYLFAGAERPA
jgi:hypothetical protein